MRPSLRLLADDLTGALDTAAEFVGVCGAIGVTWAEALPSRRPACLAVDTGTRERDKADSVAIVERLAPLLADGAIADNGDAAIAYKKVDSLLRGAWAAELGACLRTGPWTSCIVAPAFAYQGRRTIGSQQYARAQDGSWSRVGDNLLAQLAAEGLDARPGRFDTDLPAGISVFDAESEDDLDRIVAIGRSTRQPVLWCGSGGLAGALARGSDASASSVLRKPVLGLFGSDQSATAAQLAACADAVIALTETGQDNSGDHNAGLVRRKLGAELGADGVALVKFDLATGLSRGEAARRIARGLTSLTAALGPPGTLIVAGGETLRAVCTALGARALEVTGRIMPGLPCSIIRGGRWDGVAVISKSGAFGAPNLWRTLLQDNQLIIESQHT
ncbi:four-carbon acid sugar kinase family protein [Bradyrhizobium liaoningense]|uniref:four-carbon acid sugar kinase family protein n=1 Tax=Bradyrhizobium liaoningense TaxID=43992 RepID=UPI001BA733F7|nr:four-carbon acid sugar kinase family protein [Bradyrhizobium liaoningense]MBR0713813.1 Hrp-dependent type III effector protein [Bradyrhizobium liaoningense]